MSKTRCRICGTADVVSYRKSDGRFTRRTFCVEHWNAYQTRLRHAHQARILVTLPDGWELVKEGRMRPPRGVLRAVVYLTSPVGRSRHSPGRTANTVAIYTGDMRRMWNLTTLKRLTTHREVVKHLRGMGYQIVKQTKRTIVMEKAS